MKICKSGLNLFTVRNIGLVLFFLGLESIHPHKAIAQGSPPESNGQPWPTTITPTTPAAKEKLSAGITLIQQGNLGGAITAFQQAIALDPRLWQAHYNLGLALGQRGGSPKCGPGLRGNHYAPTYLCGGLCKLRGDSH